MHIIFIFNNNLMCSQYQYHTNILVTLVLIEHRSPNAPSGYAFPIQLTADVSVLKNPLYAGESVGVHLRPAPPSIIKACPAQ